MAVYSSGGHLEWREVEGGQLPSPRAGLQAFMVDGVLFVTGGSQSLDDENARTSIFSWDQVAESWQPTGDLAVARYTLAAVAVPTSLIEC